MENGVNLDIVNHTNERREALTNRYSEIKTASDEFIKGTNHPDGAFHDFRHFLNVAEAATQLLKAAQMGNDPTNFWGSLESFCKDNGFSFEDRDQELMIVMEFFGMTHDLGNSFSKAEVIDNKLVFTSIKDRNGKNQFSKEAAEDRSLQMADVVIEHYLKNKNLSEEKKVFITKLVKALTAETTFCISNRKKPFAIFARMVDQIGQALVDKNPESYTTTQRLLLNEELNDPNGFKGINAKKFGNFIENQLATLTGRDTKIQQDVLKNFTDDTVIPKYLIYGDDDTRLKELKLHPLNLRGELIRRLENHAKRWKIDDLQTTAGGYLHEILAEIELRNGTETHPLEKEIIRVLQNPRDFGFEIGQIPRNPDLIKLKYDVQSETWTLTGVEDAKRSSILNDRCIEQFSDSGILKGIYLLCRVINNAKPNTLRKWGLHEAAKIRENTNQERIIEISDDFKIHVILPFDAKDLTITKSPVDTAKATEVQEKLGKKIVTIHSHYTQNAISNLAQQLLKDYQIPTSLRPR